jgi:hypothetical protein
MKIELLMRALVPILSDPMSHDERLIEARMWAETAGEGTRDATAILGSLITPL